MWQINISASDLHQLPPKAARLLTCFFNISDGSLSHPNDARRFYGFVRHCHARRVSLGEQALRTLLMRVGCPRERAQELAAAYGHGRKLLNVPCP